MANLKESPAWAEGIYQIETGDPVLGGEGGVANRQPGQLANRTAYLKNELAKSGVFIAQILALLDKVYEGTGVIKGNAFNDAWLMQALDLLIAMHKAEANPHAQYALSGKLGAAAYRNIGTENGEIPDMSKFTSGIGWVRFPSGFMIQGGLLTTESHGGKTIPFPVAFTNKPFFITVIPHGHGAYDSIIHVNAGDVLTNTYFQCYGYYQDANGFRKDAIAFSWSAAGF